MDICGSQTLAKIKLNSKSSNHRQHNRILPKNIVLSMVLLFLISFLGGCATTIKYGSPPRINRLETLKVGGSNKADVLQSLGEPRGYGAGRFSSVPRVDEIWFYEYYISKGSKTSLTLLLVFFDKDLYDGHLWFSGTQLIDTSE
jgi:hypothetical protein